MGANMRIKVLAFAASLVLISNSSAGIQQASTTPTSSPQAATLLAQSARLLAGSTLINDVTLMGTVEWIGGSDDETGTATYKGLSGAHRLDLSLRNGTRSEIISTASGVTSGSWIGPDGISHAMANHNLMVDAGLFPVFALGTLSLSQNTMLTYVGQETRNGVSVIHVSSSQMFPSLSGDDASLMQHLTQVDIYLDSSTFLPLVYSYNSHPDNNALMDIPTEIRYSNYQTIGGTQVPLHVQKFLNNSLFLDLQFQNATFNSGLASSLFEIQ
jgi:hypothetical protein